VEAFHNAVTAVLTIRGAAKAVAFYERAFGAEEIYRNTYPDGRIVAELAVGEARFRVADEAPEVGNLSPEALGGTSVRLNLLVADPDGVAAVAIANGAIEVAPVAGQLPSRAPGRRPLAAGRHAPRPGRTDKVGRSPRGAGARIDIKQTGRSSTAATGPAVCPSRSAPIGLAAAAGRLRALSVSAAASSGTG
jgi:PhnB protein